MSSSNFYIVKQFIIDDAALTASNVAETDYAVWSGATTYAVADRVIITSGGTHNIYESVQASNTNHDPLADVQRDPNDPPVWWVLVSSTNRWKMFDYVNSSQTVNADSIDVTLEIARRPNSVFLGNVECQTIQVVMKDSLMNVVYDQTYQMYENTGTPSYYSWFLSQLQRKTDLFISDLPPYAGATLEITLTNTGADAKCGTCLVGFAEVAGLTSLGAAVGIDDFSVKQQNEFGDYELLERAYNRKGEFNVLVSNSNLDRLQNTLIGLRATPTLYVGSTRYASTYIYGFYRDFENVISYPEHTLLNIEVRGLT